MSNEAPTPAPTPKSESWQEVLGESHRLEPKAPRLVAGIPWDMDPSYLGLKGHARDGDTGFFNIGAPRRGSSIPAAPTGFSFAFGVPTPFTMEGRRESAWAVRIRMLEEIVRFEDSNSEVSCGDLKTDMSRWLTYCRMREREAQQERAPELIRSELMQATTAHRRAELLVELEQAYQRDLARISRRDPTGSGTGTTG